jgi:nitrogen fixation/metabolism regulation signal transduction histidine kinase
MNKKEVIQKTGKIDKARHYLESVLIELRAGNVRAHHFEYKMGKIIEEIDQLSIDFKETF